MNPFARSTKISTMDPFARSTESSTMDPFASSTETSIIVDPFASSTKSSIMNPFARSTESSTMDPFATLLNNTAAAAAAADVGRAIQIVEIDSNGQLVMTPEGEELLSSDLFQNQLAVAVIVGPSREGKSTMLNLLLREYGISTPEGFQTSPGVDGCTGGICIWSRPVPVKGRKHSLVLLDVEGVDDTDKNSDSSEALYCLAYLISSLFVWNKMGVIDTASLQKLAILRNSTSIIKTKASHDTGVLGDMLSRGVKALSTAANRAAVNDNDLEADQQSEQGATKLEMEHMQQVGEALHANLLWVIRDSKKLREGESPMGMLTRILESPPQHVSNAQKAACKAISLLFPKMRRNCLAICAPEMMTEEQKEDISGLDRSVLERTNRRFLEGIHQVARAIADAQPMTTQDGKCPMTGNVLLRIMQLYMRTINGRGVIDVKHVEKEAQIWDNDQNEKKLLASFETTLEQIRNQDIRDQHEILKTERSLNRDIQSLIEGFELRTSFEAGTNEKYDRLRRLKDALTAKKDVEIGMLNKKLEYLRLEAEKRMELLHNECLTLIRAQANGLLDGKTLRDITTFRSSFEKEVSATCMQLLDRYALIIGVPETEALRNKLWSALEQQQKTFWDIQKEINTALDTKLELNIVHLQDQSDRAMLYIQVDGKLKAMRDSLAHTQDTAFAFIKPDGNTILDYPPTNDEKVAIFNPTNGRVITVTKGSKDGKKYFLFSQACRVRSTPWKFGEELPESALFQVSTSGNFYQFFSTHCQGWITREMQLNVKRIGEGNSAPHKVQPRKSGLGGGSQWQRLNNFPRATDDRAKPVAARNLMQLARVGVKVAVAVCM